MEIPFELLLYPHIAGGFLALLVAPVAMIVKKGGPAHRTWGKVFFYSMVVVAVTALGMSAIKSNLFLAMVGIFSFYMAASGYRALYRRNIHSIKDVRPIDWILVAVSGIFCAILLLLGILNIFADPKFAFGYIASVFGLIGTQSVIKDVKTFRTADYYKKNWLYHHMSGMVGAYIATVSAFSAVNMDFLHPLIQWLWPTIIGTPLLIFWIRKYKNKASGRDKEATV